MNGSDTSDSPEAASPAVALVDWTDPAVAAAPQARYTELREQCPVQRDANGHVLVMSRAAVDAVLRDPLVFSSADAVEIGNIRPLIPLQVDPPDHLKYRKLLDPLFAPRAVAELEPMVTARVTELIDAFASRGHADLATELAVPLPSSIFLTLLGLPLDDLDRFIRLKDGIIRPQGDTPEAAQAVQVESGLEIYQLFERTIAERAAEPRDDLVSRFLAAEVDGERLTQEQILDICFLFLIAGLDTVTGQLSTSFAYLATHPEQRQRLVDDPALIASAVEEMLRWESIVAGIARRAHADAVIEGVEIHSGDFVNVGLGAANTDPDEFPDPFTIDFTRNPNRHIAFGGGIHRCLGSHLARLELRVALRELHRRVPDYELAPGAGLTYAPSSMRAAETVPVVFTPSDRA